MQKVAEYFERNTIRTILAHPVQLRYINFRYLSSDVSAAQRYLVICQ